MNRNGRRRFTRRHILSLLGITAAALTARALNRARMGFVLNTAADLLYGFLRPRSRILQATEHPVRYYLSLPRHHEEGSSTAIKPQALVMTIDGSDRNFWGYHA